MQGNRRQQQYTASLPKKPVSYTQDQLDFLERRTIPFLNWSGIRKPISHLLQEAYLQGVRDAVEALEYRE